MKKLLIPLLFLLLSLAGSSQDTLSKQTEEYCMIMAIQKMLSYKVTIQVDYGQAVKFFQDNREKDAAGNIATFDSVVDALNYMNSKGWEFVNAYVVTTGSQNVYHYLMRRKVMG